MTSDELKQLILTIVKKCVDLKNVYVQEKDLVIDYICIFSHSPEEYNEFIKAASETGTVVDRTKTGPVFKFHNPPETVTGKPKIFKIRMPDAAKPQLGDVDFNTEYLPFKNKYLGKNEFALIQREKFEMIELKDNKFNVLVYFSSIPQSKVIGIS